LCREDNGIRRKTTSVAWALVDHLLNLFEVLAVTELVILPLEHGHADLIRLKATSGALLALADDSIKIAFYRGLWKRI